MGDVSRQRWPQIRRGPDPIAEISRPNKPVVPPPEPGKLLEGYWDEWAPADPQPRTGYCLELHLPAGTFIVNATAFVRLEGGSAAPAEIECSLFLGARNVSLSQFPLAPAAGQSVAATTHVEAQSPTVVQWVCGSTSGPWRVSLAMTGIRVAALHRVG
jgi:hypothetical protein